MKEITQEYLQRMQKLYEKNEQLAWDMFNAPDQEGGSPELQAAIKAVLKYQAHKIHGMKIAITKLVAVENITLDLLYIIKDAHLAVENKLEAEGKKDEAAEERGSKEVIEEMIFVMTGAFPEMK
jgi:hypothetical protein